MFATLTLEHWESVLRKAVKTNNLEKLIAWRYGLQAGLAEAVARGIKDDSLDLWVIKRCRDIEKCAKFLYRKRFKAPLLDPAKEPAKYVQQARELKRKRDNEFEAFLMKSNF
jgi:hypothetical protein